MTGWNCDACELPDCAFDAPGCRLRAAAMRYRNINRAGQAMPEEVRAGYREYHRLWKIEHRARLSEQTTSHAEGNAA